VSLTWCAVRPDLHYLHYCCGFLVDLWICRIIVADLLMSVQHNQMFRICCRLAICCGLVAVLLSICCRFVVDATVRQIHNKSRQWSSSLNTSQRLRAALTVVVSSCNCPHFHIRPSVCPSVCLAIADVHESFDRMPQVAPTCTPSK